MRDDAPRCKHCGEGTTQRGRVCIPCRRSMRIEWRDPEKTAERDALVAEFWARLGGTSNEEWLAFRQWAMTKTRTFAALRAALDDPKTVKRCRTYGITELEYARRLLGQDGCCAICRVGSWIKPLNIDHDHVTGIVRGLLCTPCNTALGLLELDGEEAERRARLIPQYFAGAAARAVKAAPQIKRKASA